MTTESNLNSHFLPPIPKEAFDDITKELQRLPIPMNKYRNKAGEGRSQTWGLVGRRCLPADYSRMCWTRPLLYHLLLEFGKKYVPFNFTSITVNQNYKASPHRDKNNKGNSFLVAWGDYTGGDLKIHEGDLMGSHNIQYKPIIADFSKILHEVLDFQGERFSLVYYTFENSKSVVLPEFSVKEEGGKWFFYRGDQKITPKEGLPHPLRNRKKEKPMIQTAPPSFTVSFD